MTSKRTKLIMSSNHFHTRMQTRVKKFLGDLEDSIYQCLIKINKRCRYDDHNHVVVHVAVHVGAHAYAQIVHVFANIPNTQDYPRSKSLNHLQKCMLFSCVANFAIEGSASPSAMCTSNLRSINTLCKPRGR